MGMESEKDLSQEAKEQNLDASSEVSAQEEVSLETLQQQLAAMEASCKDFEDKYIRACASLENVRKRCEKDKEEIRINTTFYTCLPILELFDGFKLGLASATSQKIDENVLKGFQMILQQFNDCLKTLNITPIDAVNVVFDPNIHHAVSNCFHDTIPEDHVVHIVRTGYQLGERLLRPASVVVSKGKEPEKQQ